MTRSHGCLILLFALFAQSAAAPHAQAADANNGKKLYLNGPPGGGLACARCHTRSPAANTNNVLGGADRPNVISHAIDANIGNMGNLYAGRFSGAELADLAAFIGNPNVAGVPAASVSPASLTFPAAGLGQPGTSLAATLANPGSAALNLATLAVTGAAAADYTLGGTCAAGTAVAPGANCTVQVVFRPGDAGSRTASLVIGHDAPGGTSIVALGGTGNAGPQATVALSANALDFGPLASGAAAQRSLTVTNTGQAPLAFSSIATDSPDAFALSGTCGAAAPVAAGASCTLTVTANARANGDVKGTLVLASNASNTRVAVALAGSVAAAASRLAADPPAVAFGTRAIGGPAASQAVTLTNTGNVPVSFGSIAVSGAASVTIAARTCATALAVGDSCTVTLAYAPGGPGPAAATLSIASSAAPLQLPVAGAGSTAPGAAPVLSDAGPLTLPDTQVGKTSASRTITLANGGKAALGIASLALAGDGAADFAIGGSCAAGGSVAAASSCTIDVAFKPAAAGRRMASAFLTTDAGAALSVTLGGTGVAVPVPMLTVAPQAIDFGSTDVNGAASTRRIAMTNTGGTPAQLTSAAFSGPFALQAEASGGGCAAFPFTLAPGAACALTVRFAPAGAGAASGAMKLAAESGLQLDVALSGTGAVAAAPPAQAPQNAGGGGCSAVQDGKDPVLALLVILSIGVLLWRRFIRKQEGTT